MDAISAPQLDIDLDQPLREQFALAPPLLAESGLALFRSVLEEISTEVRIAATTVHVRESGRFVREARAFADVGGLSWRDVLLANLAYDLVVNFFACSTMALAGPNGPVLARNMDFWPTDELARASCTVGYRRSDRRLFENAGWPGMIGCVTGLSHRGFAIALNAVSHVERPSRYGHPVKLLIRKVLERAESFERAVRLLERTKLAAAALFTVVGTENRQRVVIERSPTRHASRWAEGETPLITTNDYRKMSYAGLQDTELMATSCARAQRLETLLDEGLRDHAADDQALLYALTDPSVMMLITAQHTIMRPREGTSRLLIPGRFVG